MRVLVIADEYDYAYYTFVYNEVKKLQEAGMEVHVICERVGKLKPDDTNYDCIPLTENKLLRTFYLGAYNRDLYPIIALYPYFRKRKKIIEKFKPDLIHFHFGHTAVRFYLTLQSTFKKYPVLTSFHGFDASSLLNRNFYIARLKPFVKKENVYNLFVSKALWNNMLAKKVPIRESDSFLLYCGIDISIFQRTQRVNNDVRIFLQISNFAEKKGHIYTLRAFKEFIAKHPGKAKLILGGDGPMKEEVVNECRLLGLDGSVEFPGWISRERAVSLLDTSDIFVHHSVTAKDGDQEGLPNAVIEAMAMELPVLSTWHSGIPELVEDGVNGFLVKERDVEEYALRMEQIMDWSYLPRNREKVEKQFSLESHTRGLINIYNTILKRRTK